MQRLREGLGTTSVISSSPVWDTLWVLATSGGSPTFVMNTEVSEGLCLILVFPWYHQEYATDSYT